MSTEVSQAQPARAANKQRNAVLFWGFGASGMAALIYEVVWERALTNTIGGSVYSFSILLAAFMAGLAIGGHYGGTYLVKGRNHLQAFGLLQLCLGLCGAATLYIINNLESIYGALFYQLRESFFLFTAAQFLLVFLVMLVPTTLMGASFPLILEAWSLRVTKVGRNAGDMYSVNTWGAALGALLAGFLLVPFLGLRWANMTAVAINLTIAFLAFAFERSSRNLFVTIIALGVTTAFTVTSASPGIFTVTSSSPRVRFGYAVADHYDSYDDFELHTQETQVIFDKAGEYGRVQVVEGKLSADQPYLFLINGGRFEGSTGNDIMCMKLLPYLPLLIHKEPKSLLNIGLGTGQSVAVAAGDRRLKSIDNVEINPLIYEAVDTHFFPGLFDGKRVSRITDDARHYLGYTDEKYDVILSQPSYPTRKTVSHLFTKEFYRIARSKLNKDGIFVQWLPLYLMDDKQLKIAVKTLREEFPNTYAWGLQDIDMFLVAMKSDGAVDVNDVQKRLRAIDGEAWKVKYVGDPKKLGSRTADKDLAVNTDDLPHIEFAAAKHKVTGVIKGNID